MPKLAITVPLREGESLISHISHLAVANGNNSVSEFCKDFRLSWSSLRQGRNEELVRLSVLSGVPIRALRRAAIIPTGSSDYILSGEHFTKRTLVQNATRVCPRCVLDDVARGVPIGRIEWHVRAYKICHTHQVAVCAIPETNDTRTCFAFQKRLEDHWTKIVDQAARSRKQPASFAFEQYLSDRFSGKYSNRWVDSLALSTIIEISERLGVVLVFGQCAFSSKLSESERSRAFHAGFSVIFDGPARILAAFESIHSSSSSRLPGFHSDFGAFARWFALVDWSKERYQSIVDLLCEFAFEKYPFEIGEKFLGRVCEEPKFMTAYSAAKKYKLDHLRTRFLARDLGFGNETAYGQILIDVEKYGKTFEEFSQCMNQKTMAAQLGINETFSSKFLSSGLIRPRFAINGLAPAFHPDDIAAFLSRIRVHAAKILNVPRDFFALSEVSIRTKQSSIEILKLCLAGRVKSLCFTKETPSLADFFVYRNEVLDLLQSEPPNGFYKQQVRPFLRVNTSTLKFLVDSGLLKSVCIKHHRSRRSTALIRLEDISDFLMRFATLGMMSYRAGIQAVHVMRRLEASGVQPIELGSSDLSRLYEREAVAATEFASCYLKSWSLTEIEEAVS